MKLKKSFHIFQFSVNLKIFFLYLHRRWKFICFPVVLYQVAGSSFSYWTGWHLSFVLHLLLFWGSDSLCTFRYIQYSVVCKRMQCSSGWFWLMFFSQFWIKLFLRENGLLLFALFEGIISWVVRVNWLMNLFYQLSLGSLFNLIIIIIIIIIIIMLIVMMSEMDSKTILLHFIWCLSNYIKCGGKGFFN